MQLPYYSNPYRKVLTCSLCGVSDRDRIYAPGHGGLIENVMLCAPGHTQRVVGTQNRRTLHRGPNLCRVFPEDHARGRAPSA